MMSGRLRRVPRFGFSGVDVRDAADAHVRAMTIPMRPANRDLSVSAAQAQRVLNWKARPDEDRIRATAQSLIDRGLIAAA